MTREKQIMYICTIQRGLGIVEGVASCLTDDGVRNMLYTAISMIEEAVEEITKDGKGTAVD